MDISFIIAQILGVMVTIVGVILAPHMKTKASLLLCNLIANLFQLAGFFLLGAITGVFTVSSIMFRVLVLFLFARVGKRAPVWVLAGLMAVHISMVLFGWEGWISALMFAPLVRLYGMWQEKLQVTRATFIITAVGFGLYSLLSGAYVVAFNEGLLIFSSALALWRFRQKENVLG